MRDIKTAIYLVGQGPYREPRPIELQYLRILRYRDALESKLGCRIDVAGEYVDVNFRRSFDGSDLTALKRLTSALEDKEYEGVLLDVYEGAGFNGHGFTPVLHRLKATGVRTYNCYSDDEGAMADELSRRYGEVCQYAMPHGYADDFVALFPGLTASIVNELLGDDRWTPSVTMANFEKTVRSLAEENPYIASSLPLFWDGRRRELEVVLEARKEDRRKTEVLYLLGPEERGVLCDANSHGDARNEAELAWAEVRLCDVLGFHKRLEGQFVSYTQEIEGHVVYADPRLRGKIDLNVYAIPQDAPSGIQARRCKENSGFEAQGHRRIGVFYLQDAWIHDLPGKYRQRLTEVTLRRQV